MEIEQVNSVHQDPIIITPMKQNNSTIQTNLFQQQIYTPDPLTIQKPKQQQSNQLKPFGFHSQNLQKPQPTKIPIDNQVANPIQVNYLKSSNKKNQTLAQSKEVQDFLANYSVFINQVSEIKLDMNYVLNSFKENTSKMQPPNKLLLSPLFILIFYSFSQRSQEIWKNIANINKNVIQEESQKFSQMKEKELYDCISNAEKLNLQLMLEFKKEINRSQNMNLIKHE